MLTPSTRWTYHDNASSLCQEGRDRFRFAVPPCGRAKKRRTINEKYAKRGRDAGLARPGERGPLVK